MQNFYLNLKKIFRTMQNNEISIKFPSFLQLFYLDGQIFKCFPDWSLGFSGWALFLLIKKEQFVSLKPEISAIF